LLASTRLDVVGTGEQDSHVEDSESDKSVEIFDLERLDFDDEDGLEEVLE
jgi:hypothetical protein